MTFIITHFCVLSSQLWTAYFTSETSFMPCLIKSKINSNWSFELLTLREKWTFSANPSVFEHVGQFKFVVVNISLLKLVWNFKLFLSDQNYLNWVSNSNSSSFLFLFSSLLRLQWRRRRKNFKYIWFFFKRRIKLKFLFVYIISKKINTESFIFKVKS